MGTDTPKYRNEPESGGHSSSCQNPLVFARRFGFPAFWVTRFQLAKTRHVRDAVQTPAKRREHHEG